MQNLLWKFAVLAGVIGGSCLAVWQAHQALQRGADETDASAFTQFEPDADDDSDPFDGPSPTPAPLHGRLEPIPDFDDEPEPTLAASPPSETGSPGSDNSPPAGPEPPTDGFSSFELSLDETPPPPGISAGQSERSPDNRMIFLPSGGGSREVSASAPRGFPAMTGDETPARALEPGDEPEPTPAPVQQESDSTGTLVDLDQPPPGRDVSQLPQPEPLADPTEDAIRPPGEPRSAANPLTLFGPNNRQAGTSDGAVASSASATTESDTGGADPFASTAGLSDDDRPSGRIRLPDSSPDPTEANGAIELASAEMVQQEASGEDEVLPARMLFDADPQPAEPQPAGPAPSVEEQDEVLPVMPISDTAVDPPANTEEETTPEFNTDTPASPPAQENPFAFDLTPEESTSSSEPTEDRPARRANPFVLDASPDEPETPDSPPVSGETAGEAAADPQEPEPTVVFPERVHSPRSFPGLPAGPGFEGDLELPGNDAAISASPQPLPESAPAATGDRPAPRGMPFPLSDDEPQPEEPPVNSNEFEGGGFPDAKPALGEDDVLPSMTLPTDDAGSPPLTEDASPEASPAVADEPDAEVVPRSLPLMEDRAFPLGDADEKPVHPAPGADADESVSPGEDESPSSIRPDQSDDEPAGRMSTNGSELLGDAEYDPDIPSDPQTPELKIEKIAPEEAVLGEPLVYAIRIRNVGGGDAREVVVEDRIPRGTKLEGTIPQAVLANGKLIWDLGTLPAGEERKIQLKVTPMEPGRIGSVATVSFAAAVSTSIRVTAPQLSVEMEGPDEAVVGERLPYRFVVRNSGEGNAREVYIRAILPEELQHPGGNDIEYKVGDLPAGESREIDLILTAATPGTVTPHVLVTVDSKTYDEARADLRVIPSRLDLARNGPSRRFVGRPAEFVNKVTNQSNQTLQHITVTEHVPEGLELASEESSSIQVASATIAPAEGKWDPQQRTLSWYVRELGPGESVEFPSRLVATRTGTHEGKVTAHEGSGSQVELDSPLEVKGFSDLGLDLSTESRTVLVGEQVSLRLRLKNDGTAPANTVAARFVIPPGLTFVNARGPADFEREGNVIRFASLDELPADAEETFHLVLTAAEPGTTKVTATLESADYSEPIVTEEPVRILEDAP
jgi:uncharacterized repeat protein (TIGR01451 family)